MKYLVLAAAIMVGTAFGPATETTFSIDTKTSKVYWQGSKLTGTHNGTLLVSSGYVKAKGNIVTDANITMNMASITDNDGLTKLEGHLKSPDFFGVNKYPTSSFEASKIIPIKKDSKGNNYKVIGNLTIKGKTETISFPAKITIKGNELTANGKFTFDRSKFDVRYGSDSFFNNLGDKVIYDDVAMKFVLNGTRESIN